MFDKGVFYFDNSHRPVPLEQQVIAKTLSVSFHLYIY